MYLGRYYIKRGKWIAALNRFKTVIEKHDKTVFIEEALHRMVEINYKIVLDESQKYANILEIIIYLVNGIEKLLNI